MAAVFHAGCSGENIQFRFKYVAGAAWTTVFSEVIGTGNGAQFDNSDIRTLNLVKPPFDVTKGNYRVRMEWGSGGWSEFTVGLALLLYVRSGISPRCI